MDTTWIDEAMRMGAVCTVKRISKLEVLAKLVWPAGDLVQALGTSAGEAMEALERATVEDASGGMIDRGAV